VLAVRPAAIHPQVISTSRHVTQGMVDVSEEKWDDATKTLSGRSKVVAGEAYELRIVTGNRNTVPVIKLSTADMAADVKVAIIPDDNSLIRVQIGTPESREVSWSVNFFK
jgi:hypothetical protein